MQAQNLNALPVGHRLHWYRIDRVLGQGTFGITYLAYDTNLGRRVSVKEFLPLDLATRTSTSQVCATRTGDADTYAWGLKRFVEEARTLARFSHSNIVRVYSIFEENDTAYMVMEYEQGRSLEEELRAGNWRSEHEVLALLSQLLDGLEVIHNAGFIHRDIKPANIFVRQDGSPVWLDFGSARHSLGLATRTMTSLVTPGYAPFEQYNASKHADKQGAWTDLYSLGATLYRALTGEPPADALGRASALLSETDDSYRPLSTLGLVHYTPLLLTAIDYALEFRAQDRPQDVHAWRTALPPLPTEPLDVRSLPAPLGTPADVDRPRFNHEPATRIYAADAASTETPEDPNDDTDKVAAEDAETTAELRRAAEIPAAPQFVDATRLAEAGGRVAESSATEEPRVFVSVPPRRASPATRAEPDIVAQLHKRRRSTRRSDKGSRVAMVLGVLATFAVVAGVAAVLTNPKGMIRIGGENLLAGSELEKPPVIADNTRVTAAPQIDAQVPLVPVDLAGSSEPVIVGGDGSEIELEVSVPVEMVELQVPPLRASSPVIAPPELLARVDIDTKSDDTQSRDAQSDDTVQTERLAVLQPLAPAAAADDYREPRGATKKPPTTSLSMRGTTDTEPLTMSRDFALRTPTRVRRGPTQNSPSSSVARRALVLSLLQAAREDLREYRLTRPPENNALARFRKALALEPGNERAKEGILEVAQRYAEFVTRALDEESDERIEGLLARGKALFPGNEALASVSARWRAIRSARGTASATSAAATVQPRDQRFAFFPNRVRGPCIQVTGAESLKAGRAVLEERRLGQFIYPYANDGSVRLEPPESYWSAQVQSSSIPNLDKLVAAGRALGVHGLLLVQYTCNQARATQRTADVYLVDVPENRMYSATTPLRSINEAMLKVFSAYTDSRS